MLEYGYDFETVDYLTGPVVGHPRSATFGTNDLVGLDILFHVAGNIREKLLEAVSDQDEKIMEMFLEGEEIPEDMIKAAIRDGLKEAQEVAAEKMKPMMGGLGGMLGM